MLPTPSRFFPCRTDNLGKVTPPPATTSVARPTRQLPWRLLAGAGYKRVRSVLRSLGLTPASPTHPQWQARAELCARCPVAVTEKGVLYCGKPLLAQLSRPSHEGCGCPILPKAKDPAEHCPVTPALTALPASVAGVVGACECKWCSAGLAPAARGAAEGSTGGQTEGQ